MVKRKLWRLKIFTIILLISALLVPAYTGALDPQPEPPMIQVFVDGKLLQLDVSPLLEQGRTLVPLRAIFEALGADVSWDSASQTVTATKGPTALSLQVGNPTAQKNGEPITLQVPAKITGGRTLVPLRFVGEALGAGVNWDGAARKVLVDSTGTTPGTTSQSPSSVTTPSAQTDSSSPTNPSSSSGIELNPNLLKHLQIKSFVTLPDGNRAVTLANNKIYPLMQLANIKELANKIAPASTTPPWQVTQYLGKLKPQATVDLRQWQTPLRDQGGRNTCVSFALLAAMEARYKRLDPAKYGNLDLSEQYAHHLQKIADIGALPSVEDNRENPLGAWGYGHTSYSASLFTKYYGVPPETALPYISAYSYEDTNEKSDYPQLPSKGLDSMMITQKTINDLNLAEERLPLSALEQAGYRIDGFVGINDADLNNVEHYKAILSAGYEIVFAMAVTSPDPTPNDNIWNPGSKVEGYHAMVLVGYDDQRQVFIVKNSYGFDNLLEGGYTLLSFDYFKKDYIVDALYITSVDKTPEKPAKPEQLFLGRWNMVHDGVPGILDIYRLPGIFEPSALFNHTDRRIGTYFKSNGSTYRVNGAIKGNKLEFYIDFNSTYNPNYDDQGGTKFTGYLFSWDHNYLAGSFNNPNFVSTYGFYATRGDTLDSVPRPQSFSYSSYEGTWSLNLDGRKGKLEITAVDDHGVITGRFTDSNDNKYNITGKAAADNKRSFQLQIPFDSVNPQIFNGYLHFQDLGLISGTTMWNNQTFGFVANRTGGIAVSLPDSSNTSSGTTPSLIIPLKPKIPVRLP